MSWIRNGPRSYEEFWNQLAGVSVRQIFPVLRIQIAKCSTPLGAAVESKEWNFEGQSMWAAGVLQAPLVKSGSVLAGIFSKATDVCAQVMPLTHLEDPETISWHFNIARLRPTLDKKAYLVSVRSTVVRHVFSKLFIFEKTIFALRWSVCRSRLKNEVENGVHRREKKAGIHILKPFQGLQTPMNCWWSNVMMQSYLHNLLKKWPALLKISQSHLFSLPFTLPDQCCLVTSSVAAWGSSCGGFQIWDVVSRAYTKFISWSAKTYLKQWTPLTILQPCSK